MPMFFVMMPSCVPATAIDDNGCTLTAQDMEPYLLQKKEFSDWVKSWTTYQL